MSGFVPGFYRNIRLWFKSNLLLGEAREFTALQEYYTIIPSFSFERLLVK